MRVTVRLLTVEVRLRQNWQQHAEYCMAAQSEDSTKKSYEDSYKCFTIILSCTY